MIIAPHHRIYTCFFLFAVSLGALLDPHAGSAGDAWGQ